MVAANYAPMLATGATIKIALLERGDTAEPTATTITLASEVAQNLAGPGSIAVPALATGVKIPANASLSWEDPAAGGVVPTKVTTKAEATDTTIATVNIPQTIPSGSVAKWPPELEIRTGFNVDRSGNTVDYVTLRSNQQSQILVSVSGTMSFDGFFSPLDAAYRMLEEAQNTPLFVYVILEMPKSSVNVATGKIFKGLASVTGIPLDGAGAGIIGANVTLGAASGGWTVTEEVFAAE
ncbi:MAG: hypothetical protein AAFX78_04980 [Cyanobacteria bacterium J06638_20]